MYTMTRNCNGVAMCYVLNNFGNYTRPMLTANRIMEILISGNFIKDKIYSISRALGHI